MVGYEMIKLSAEVFSFLTVTVAFYVIARSKKLLEQVIGSDILQWVFWGIAAIWTGFLIKVLNGFLTTGVMGAFGDILVAVGLMALLVALLKGGGKRSTHAVHKVIGSGDPLMLRGFYLYNEGNGIEKLLKRLGGGAKVLAVTRNPDPLRNTGVPYIWMTKLNVKEGVLPTRLAPLLQYIVDRADGNTVVLVDCVEYLIIENGFKAVFKFLTTLKDYLSTKGATLILIVNRKTMDKRELTLLEKEFKWLSGKV